MVRENTGVRTKIAKISGGVRDNFVRTELSWQFGMSRQFKFGDPTELSVENRCVQKFGRKFTVVPWAARRASAEVATTCGDLGGVEGV